MFKSVVYHGGALLGEAEIYPNNPAFAAWNREIRVSHLSPPSERCPPLAVFHTIATDGVCFRMESKPPLPSEESPMFLLHAACLRENKTAVISLGESELHLVAMASRNSFETFPRFWGFSIPTGLYNSCLVLLNLRCLGIVFDLDETLVVANTLRSFEDKIDALQRKINSETDTQRASVMLAEVKRYQDDRSILKQYSESDQVFENGKIFKVQTELVPPLCDGQQSISRPIVRLHEKNIILTRINPSNRDTSVLVRPRPGWEDLRSYLTARGRKRFEVYVCTLAERDYAIEMWRLLDPESNLINSKQLLNRIVCVKPGMKKSLLNVFQDGICHPKLALVIDDRLKVWDDKDQSRVHVVPAFAPYYAPQAETNCSVTVLCVARNVACNVRACFFKEFDEGLLPRISQVLYEDDITSYPPAPDVGNYLISEDDSSVSNGNKDPICLEGLGDIEVERRLKESIPPGANNLDPRLVSSLPHAVSASTTMVSLAAPPPIAPLHGNQFSQIITSVQPLGHSGLSEPSIQGSPAREEGEVPESELDPDTRRRLLILQHGQDTREHTANDTLLSGRPPLQVSVPPVQSHGSWFPVDGEMSPRQLNRVPKEYSLDSEPLHYDKKRYNHPSFFYDVENRGHSNKGFRENNRFSKKVYRGYDHPRANRSTANYDSFSGEEMPSGHMSSSIRNAHFEAEQVTFQYPGTPVEVLQDIAAKCGAKVEFETGLVDSTELRFCIEVKLEGSKVGEGSGKTRKEAQHHASENSIWNLADKYVSNPPLEPVAAHGDMNKNPRAKENGFACAPNTIGHPTNSKDDALAVASMLEQSRFQNHRLDGYRSPMSSVLALKELCTLQGYRVNFQGQPSVPMDSVNDGEVYAQVEICGRVLGKGIGMTWEDAKLQAAEEALGSLTSMPGQFMQKRSGSPRSSQTSPNKRVKADYPRSLQRISSSSRYSKNETLIP